MTDAKLHTHQSLAQAVIDQGGEVMFGLMGDGNLFMVNDYVQRCGGKFVTATHEANTVLMAMGYATVTGKTGVATVTHGPAFTNCLTSLVEAERGRAPVVLLAGDTALINPQNLQNIDQREIAKAAGAGFVQVRAPDTAAEDVARAFHLAARDRRPVVLNMPVEFMWEEAAHQTHRFPVPDTPAYVPEGEAFDDALGLVASARRPLILAGRGAYGARDKLIRLAERMEAPLATTLKGRDQFRHHPNNIGIFGTLSSPAAYDVIGAADVIVAFGAALHFFTTDHGGLLKGKKIVHIDRDPAAIGLYTQADAALIADAGLTADNIVHWLDEAEIPPTGFAKEIDPETVTRHPPGDPAKSRDGYIDFAYALDRLDQALPANRILATDGGQFATEVWVRVAATDPMSNTHSVNFAAIGQGMGMAIGAAHGAPDRPVAFFTGDGGFMLGGLTEFNSAVRSGADLITILCNDAAYGAEHIQFRDRQMDPSLSHFNWPSFAEVATSLEGEGVTVASPDDLEHAIERIGARTKPILIELRLHPDDMPRMRY